MGKSQNRELRLKQFSVRDDRCAMKVGTDALVLGAWAALPAEGASVLDVGTGSGILAMMAAQRCPKSEVVAVELDPDAASQARENVAQSPFQARILVVEEDFLQFAVRPELAGTFGAVWANPPYFRDKPASPDPARTRARHESALPLAAWLPACVSLLTATGTVSLVWPIDRELELHHIAREAGFHAVRSLRIHGRSDRPPIRVAVTFARTPADAATEEMLCVELGDRAKGFPQRSADYLTLLSPFVLDEGDPRKIR